MMTTQWATENADLHRSSTWISSSLRPATCARCNSPSPGVVTLETHCDGHLAKFNGDSFLENVPLILKEEAVNEAGPS